MRNVNVGGTVRGIALVVAMTWTLLLLGCASEYNQIYRAPPNSAVVVPDQYELHFVETDDEGWLWNAAQAQEAMDSIEDGAAHVDTYVLVFVHGWHHSAGCCDDNVAGFRETLRRLNAELRLPVTGGGAGGASNGPGAVSFDWCVCGLAGPVAAELLGLLYFLGAEECGGAGGADGCARVFRSVEFTVSGSQCSAEWRGTEDLFGSGHLRA